MDLNEQTHNVALALAYVPAAKIAYEIERCLEESMANRAYSSSAKVNKSSYEEAVFFIKLVKEVDAHFGMGYENEVMQHIPSMWKDEYDRASRVALGLSEIPT